ncbi:MAG: rod shape-determining protein RodA [Patescibacteria group bacterium]|nr:rod shape-determining protein RodA [Patescibacteria group bacterium]
MPLVPARPSYIDWVALLCALALSFLGLTTMTSFEPQDPFFVRQALWIGIGLIVFFTASRIDWRFLRRTGVALGFWLAVVALLGLLVVVGHTAQGAKSWFDLGGVGLQPTELAKLALIVLLAKYFSRRHIEIANIRHILVSGAYAGVLFMLVTLQPDFGSAVIIACIWFGMALLSGLSRTHLFAVIGAGLVLFGGLWFFGFHDYQKQRIISFFNPTDVHGAGYNAYQSTVAVGSGQLLGKGIGYGTQSRLRFLPQFQTDFIFAAFAEEWGFLGVVLLLGLYGILAWRMLRAASRGASNFETLFALGVLSWLMAHVILHVGINMGLLPVTGTTIPFMSYGGSHLLVEFLALGMLSGMSRYARAAHPESLERDWQGGYDALKGILR